MASAGGPPFPLPSSPCLRRVKDFKLNLNELRGTKRNDLIWIWHHEMREEERGEGERANGVFISSITEGYAK